MQKFCEQCGSVLHEGDKFCDSCGTAVPEINNVQSSQNVSNSRQTSSKPSRNNTAKIFIPIVLVAALVGLGIWAGMNYFQTEKEVVTEAENPSQNVSDSSAQTNIPEHVANAPVPQLGIEWIQDINTGIYLKNPEPTDGESITWSGGYVQDGAYKFADGYGTTTWYRYGELKQVDEGTFIKGERNGKFKHKFYPSGNVDYSDWDHGTEITNAAISSERWIFDFGMYSYYAITDSYIGHADRGAELDIAIRDQDGGALIGIVHYSFEQTNDSRGFRFYTSSGQSGWMIEDRTAKPVFDYIANYLHTGTS